VKQYWEWNTFIYPYFDCLEDTEGLLSGLDVDSGFVSNNVETNSLGKRTALSNGDNITILDSESWGAVSSNVLVSLLESTVLGDVVKVISADDNGTLHLGGDDESLQNTSSDGNISSKGALLVNEVTLDGCGRSTNSKTNVFHITHWLSSTLGTNGTLTSDENGILGLVSLLVLVALDIFLSDTWDSRHLVIIQTKRKSCKGKIMG
jgi:hypothetical protein